MCGKNTGQHIYIPIENSRKQPMITIVTAARSGKDYSSSLEMFKELYWIIQNMKLICKIVKLFKMNTFLMRPSLGELWSYDR